jgi:hypothetical protein
MQLARRYHAFEARDRIGELSQALEKAPSGRAAVSGNIGVTSNGKRATLKDAGLSPMTAQRCEQVHRAFKARKAVGKRPHCARETCASLIVSSIQIFVCLLSCVN